MAEMNYKKALDIVVARRKLSCSVNVISTICGVSRQAIYDFESGKSQSFKLLLKYMSFLLTRDEAGDLIMEWGL